MTQVIFTHRGKFLASRKPRQIHLRYEQVKDWTPEEEWAKFYRTLKTVQPDSIVVSWLYDSDFHRAEELSREIRQELKFDQA